MRSNEAKAAVREGTKATSQFISVAKTYIVRHMDGGAPAQTIELMQAFLKAQDAADPGVVVVPPMGDATEGINRASRYLSFSLSFIEALYRLVGSGLLMPADTGQNSWSGAVSYTTGGESGGWNWAEMRFAYPARVIAAPSLWDRAADETPLESSIFVQEVVEGIASDTVTEALSDAVLCMRQELHRPAVVMLGKAVEGAWIELGQAMSLAMRGTGATHDKFVDEIAGKYGQFARTIDSVLKLCRDNAHLLKQADVRMSELEFAAAWSNVVREARNAIHPTATPVVPPTYEATYALMLGARMHLRRIYELRDAVGPAKQNN